ncbi:hypothetical protein QZH41_016443, partial [Actinostola sp. cb2023]
LFESEEGYSQLSICPWHRGEYGIRWRSCRVNCCCPSEWILHKKSARGERGVTVAMSRKLLKLTKILVQIGQPICTQCRKRLEKDSEPEPTPVVTERTQEIYPSVVDDSEGMAQVCEGLMNRSIDDGLRNDSQDGDSDDISALCKSMTSMCLEQDSSQYIPADDNSNTGSTPSEGNEQESASSFQRKHLNAFLQSCGVPEVGVSKKRWEEASDRTRQRYVTKSKDVVVAALQVICPEDAGLLWQSLQTSKLIEKELDVSDESPSDRKYLCALAETYNNATSWDTKRQVLSVMADLLPFKRIRTYLPGITDYRVHVARQHKLVFGRGVPLPHNRSVRMRVSDSQLDHFLTFITSPHLIQDLPFGQKYLKLSTGEVLETPNVIRTMIPERVVSQYQQYCRESGFTPFGRTTMLSILNACSATVRKSLQGLDYIATEGSKAFDNLCLVVRRLQESGVMSRELADNWTSSLKNSKQYIKCDYKVHISSSSPVADHCCAYALSDEKEAAFCTTCQHEHDQVCSHCEMLKEVLFLIQEYVNKDLSLDEDELVDLRYTSQRSVEEVQSWKAHQLRTVRQDMARLDALKHLDESSILMTQDWAMKFLPQKFRESQTDWFAKRGISWHISVVAIKKDGKLLSQAFVHVVENCNQDASVVVRIIEHVLRTLKQENPDISKAYLRSDNAGCYHSAIMLSACRYMGSKTGINVSRVDFSDPQGGKGSCDRKAAAIKAHVRRFINEGHDVDNSRDFHDAILSVGGATGVRVTLVDASNLCDDPVKWEGVSSLNNFLYSGSAVTVWRAYDVGNGKKVEEELSPARVSRSGSFSQIFSEGTFMEVSQRRSSKQRQRAPAQPPTDSDSDSDASESGLDRLFQCPNEGCIKVYQRHSGLENHLSYGKCELQEERHTLLDKAKSLYHEKLMEGATAGASLPPNTVDAQASYDVPPTQGWALKFTRKATRFNDSQKKYLDEKFGIGQQTGHKLDPANVARDMRFAKGTSGAKLFSLKEFLTAQQIQSYFSRKAAKLRQQTVEDEGAAREQQQYCETRAAVQRDVGLQHPITYDHYDLCAMHTSQKLNHLSLALLRLMCEHFDIDISHIKARRKAPYTALLTSVLEECSCHQ